MAGLGIRNENWTGRQFWRSSGPELNRPDNVPDCTPHPVNPARVTDTRVYGVDVGTSS